MLAYNYIKGGEKLTTKEQALAAYLDILNSRPRFDIEDYEKETIWEQNRDSIRQQAEELGASTFDLVFIELDTALPDERQIIFNSWLDDRGDLNLDQLVELRDSFGLEG